jgi:hypothetical protein
MNAVTSIAQANSGIFIRLMPGAREQDADDQLDGARDRRDLDEADAQQPPVRADARRMFLAGERRVHEPAAVRRGAEKDRAEETEAADGIGPEGVGRQARKGQVARGQHVGQQIDCRGFDHRHRKQEHHHRAVHGEELVVGGSAHQGVARYGQLGAHDERQHTGQHEEQHGGGHVVEPDVDVVDGG